MKFAHIEEIPLVFSNSQNFFSRDVVGNLISNVAPRFIIACGVSGCLITKGTDLSAGRQVGLAACLAAMMQQTLTYSARVLPWMPDMPWIVALVVTVILMSCIGAVNGCAIAFLTDRCDSRRSVLCAGIYAAVKG